MWEKNRGGGGGKEETAKRSGKGKPRGKPKKGKIVGSGAFLVRVRACTRAYACV